MDKVLIKIKRDPLAGFTKESFLEALIQKLEGRVLEAYIFGSFFSDDFNENSDIDIILVKKSNTPFLKRGEEFFDLLDIGPSLDILVYTPDELENLLKEDIGFWKSVKESLQKIL